MLSNLENLPETNRKTIEAKKNVVIGRKSSIFSSATSKANI